MEVEQDILNEPVSERMVETLSEIECVFSTFVSSQVHLLSLDLKQFVNPVNESQHPAGKYPIQYYRTSNGKDLASDTEDLTFLLILDRRSRNGVSEACDWD